MSLGFPRMGSAGRPHLAVVGGGPSIASKLDVLENWDGEIWAINGAFHWLLERGIKSTFFSIDQSPLIAGHCKGATKAVLAMWCDPSVFDALRSADVFAVKAGKGEFENGPSTATTAPPIAVEFGYRELTFFGCESSYEGFTHVYQGAVRPKSLMRVACDGETFLTHPGMLMQAEMLAEIIRSAPAVFKEESGGLLRAMVRSPEYDVVAASKAIHDALASPQTMVC